MFIIPVSTPSQAQTKPRLFPLLRLTAERRRLICQQSKFLNVPRLLRSSIAVRNGADLSSKMTRMNLIWMRTRSTHQRVISNDHVVENDNPCTPDWDEDQENEHDVTLPKHHSVPISSNENWVQIR